MGGKPPRVVLSCVVPRGVGVFITLCGIRFFFTPGGFLVSLYLMGLKEDAIEAAKGYLKSNPTELIHAAKNALGLRLGIPFAALRWLCKQAEASGKVKHLDLTARAPGIGFTADLDLMSTPVRASGVVFIERVAFSEEELTIAIRLEDVKLKVTGEAATPVAALIKSGALDLSSPGNLAAHLPSRPRVLVEAEGSRLVLDLMRDRRIGENPLVRIAVGLLTSFITVHGIETSAEYLDVVFRTFPRGYVQAARAVGLYVVQPVMNRYLPVPVRVFAR